MKLGAISRDNAGNFAKSSTRVHAHYSTLHYYLICLLQNPPTVGEIGPLVNLTLDAANRGPSNAFNVMLDIYIPTNNTSNSFYLYPFNVMTDLALSISCDTSRINPQNLQLSRVSGRRSRRYETIMLYLIAMM